MKNNKILKKGDIIQIKIEDLNIKGRAYGYYEDNENKIYTNINAAKGQIVEGIFVKRRRKYELIRCKIVDFAGKKNAIYDEIERQNGGCNYQYYFYDEQAQMKSNNIFQEIKSVVQYDFKFEKIVKSIEKEKYRNEIDLK